MEKFSLFHVIAQIGSRCPKSGCSWRLERVKYFLASTQRVVPFSLSHRRPLMFPAAAATDWVSISLWRAWLVTPLTPRLKMKCNLFQRPLFYLFMGAEPEPSKEWLAGCHDEFAAPTDNVSIPFGCSCLLFGEKAHFVICVNKRCPAKLTHTHGPLTRT